MRDAACFARRVPNRLSLSQTDFARHIVLLPHGKKQPLRRGGFKAGSRWERKVLATNG